MPSACLWTLISSRQETCKGAQGAGYKVGMLSSKPVKAAHGVHAGASTCMYSLGLRQSQNSASVPRGLVLSCSFDQPAAQDTTILQLPSSPSSQLLSRLLCRQGPGHGTEDGPHDLNARRGCRQCWHLHGNKPRRYGASIPGSTDAGPPTCHTRHQLRIQSTLPAASTSPCRSITLSTLRARQWRQWAALRSADRHSAHDGRPWEMSATHPSLQPAPFASRGAGPAHSLVLRSARDTRCLYSARVMFQ